MPLALTAEDTRILADLLAALPEWGLASGRQRLMEAAFQGSPRSRAVLGRLDLDGRRRPSADAAVNDMLSFGQLEFGREALGVFLNYLRSLVGAEQTDWLDGLFRRYPLDGRLAVAPPVQDWRRPEDPAVYQEKVVGQNTLRHVNMLEKALLAARSVVHLTVTLQRGDKDDGRDALGSGFLVAPGLLMTNRHVIANAVEAMGTVFRFDYQLDRAGRAREPVVARALDGGAFTADVALDYAVVELANVPEPTWLTLRAQQPALDAAVPIIQHPGGFLKQISMAHNFVLYSDERIVQYTTTTLPGSSGSPVFNEDFEVIALHHEGGWLADPAWPGDRLRVFRNEGVAIGAILADLAVHAPDIHARIVAAGRGGAAGEDPGA